MAQAQEDQWHVQRKLILLGMLFYLFFLNRMCFFNHFNEKNSYYLLCYLCFLIIIVMGNNAYERFSLHSVDCAV